MQGIEQSFIFLFLNQSVLGFHTFWMKLPFSPSPPPPQKKKYIYNVSHKKRFLEKFSWGFEPRLFGKLLILMGVIKHTSCSKIPS